MNREPDVLVGIDLGTTKVSVIVAERDARSRSVRVLGVGSEPTQGILKGSIASLEQATRSVRRAVRLTGSMVKFPLTSATVSFSGTGIESVISTGMISLGRTLRQVNESDLEGVIEAAQSSVSVPPNMFPLHTIPVRYSMDGNSEIDDPLGMTGMRLEMDLQTVSVPITDVQNIVNCVENAGIKVEGLLVKPLASSLGSLTRDEMDRGVISLCIGGGTSALAFYRNGRPVGMSVIPVGGDHITNDLAAVFRIPVKEAESLKQKLFTEPEEALILEQERLRRRIITPDAMIEVISSRIEELFNELVAPEIAKRGGIAKFPGGIVLSGGVANTPEIDEVVCDILRMPTRIASPLDSYQMPMGRTDSSYVDVVGILRYVLAKERNEFSFIETPTSDIVRSRGRVVSVSAKQKNSSGGSNGGGIGAVFGGLRKTIEELI